MKKNKLLIISTFTILSLLTSCSTGGTSNGSVEIGSYNSVVDEGVNSVAEDTNTSSFTIVTDNSSAVNTGSETSNGDTSSSSGEGSSTVSEGTIYNITASGEYYLTGQLTGQVYVNLSEDDTDKVVIYLNGVSITNSSNSPIFIEQADKVHIVAVAGTNNFIYDTRSAQTEDTDDESIGGGAIYAKCDMKIKGTGSLYVQGNYNNGIHSKDDLTIDEVTLHVEAYNNAIKGNDSLTIDGGVITAISTGGDALKTSNSDISSKGNQRGTISITGGTLHLYACQDAIDASYNVEISNDPEIYCYTDSYSEYSGEVSTVSSSTLYIKMASSYYSSSYRYALYFYDNDGNYKWVNASYYTSQSASTGRPGSSSSTYYFYKVEVPSGFSNVKIYRFSASQSENSTSTYVAVSEGDTLNSSKDMVTITVSNGVINLNSWGTYSTASTGYGPGGMGGMGGQSSGNTSAQDYSTKGIKADNEVIISGGTILVNATDDGIHANDDVTLENGSQGTGNVTISGGVIDIASSDDGVHADNVLTISGGSLAVTKSYEGLEANQILISGGSSTIVASDDGLNANDTNPIIKMTGGFVDVSTGSGDTDTIDSNGSFTMTGGTIIAKNGNGGSNMNAGLIDCDGSVSVTGGTFIGLGAIGQTFSNAKYSTSLSLQAGNYSMSDGTNELCSWTTSTTYKGFMFYSSSAVSGTTYTLYRGSTSAGFTYSR